MTLGVVLLGAPFANSAILLREPGPILVRDNGDGEDILLGKVEPRNDASSDVLYFKFTVDPLADAPLEQKSPIQAGLVLYADGEEHLGVGNGLRAHAYSAFNTSTPGLFLAPYHQVVGENEFDLNAQFEGSTEGLMGRPRRGIPRTILFRVEYVPDADDLVTVWFEPDLSPGATEQSQRPGQITRFRADASFDTVRLVHRGVGDGWRFRDVAVATSFADFVPRHWWQRTWVIGGAVLLLLGSIVTAVRMVERAKARRQIRSLERQRALDQERARIARDLHDDVGAELTELLLMTETVERMARSKPELGWRMRQMLTSISRLGDTMDEIVWAVNPNKDSVSDLVGYLSSFAQEFLGPSGIRCRLNVPTDLPELGLASRARHSLFLAVKEALNNAVKHSGASEVELRVRCSAGELIVDVEDNGKGFDVAQAEGKGNGLHNLRLRMDACGGRIELRSAAGKGALVRLVHPLDGAGGT